MIPKELTPALKPEKIRDIQYLLNRMFLIAENLGIPKCSLFLGAGCSVSSGIPTGGIIIEICRKLAFSRIHRDARLLRNAESQDFDAYLKSVDNFVKARQNEFHEYVAERELNFRKRIDPGDIILRIPGNIRETASELYGLTGRTLDDRLAELFAEAMFEDSLYGDWFEEFSQDPKDRRWLIEQLINEKHPGGAYILLANMIKRGIINTVFTTNFDDLLNDALVSYCMIKSRVYSHNEIVRYLSIPGKRPNIIKLHGDFLFENIRNIVSETSELLPNMKTKFQEILNHLDLVVIGYRGADYSIIGALEELKTIRDFGLIWCAPKPAALHWRVVNLINSTSNSFFVALDTFESFVNRLWTDSGGTPYNRAEQATFRQMETISQMWDQIAAITRELNLTMKEGQSVFKTIRDSYMDRISALEYTYTHDDGLHLDELDEADIVIVGLPRTYKSTTSQYLAFKGYRVANVPIMLDKGFPVRLTPQASRLIVFFDIEPSEIAAVRQKLDDRFKGGMTEHAHPLKIKDELRNAYEISCNYPEWKHIDVTGKTVEMIASEIINLAADRDILPGNH